jgi:hypothetical protein
MMQFFHSYRNHSHHALYLMSHLFACLSIWFQNDDCTPLLIGVLVIQFFCHHLSSLTRQATTTIGFHAPKATTSHWIDHNCIQNHVDTLQSHVARLTHHLSKITNQMPKISHGNVGRCRSCWQNSNGRHWLPQIQISKP